jgi:hypothetical protein
MAVQQGDVIEGQEIFLSDVFDVDFHTKSLFSAWFE